ncbi:SPOR domain-containing protein [Sphingomonas lacusdianchii]|uniref:SPOR domain-containing protein n=1 Tax=Sphingomonas lacusdianchii TaxID=2917992 RepID=UPI001F5A9AD0|nr:SPOR domain-containing protein [Sphingomonas sp. JXJ CY 53]
MTRFPLLSATALLLATAAPLPVAAQSGAIVQSVTTPNADRLSEQMRILGRNPNDVSALVEAGRLSGKLGDTDAAMQFLARAEKVAPSDPRIRAARAVALVGMERPGEALALFASAERAGVAMTPYLAERGLAYDLLGQGALAQADYRQVLRAGEDDEVTRRLALSLGIDGNLAEATKVLNPLLVQNDRAAWRVRAFTLAMSGDAAGADKITASMLPGFAASLSPFFRRLPQLAGADRAFAVHFGRLAPTPERIADARLAPSFPAPVRATAPVAVAAATPAPAPVRQPSAAERRRQAAAEQARSTAEAQARQLAQARADETARRESLARLNAERAAQAQRERDAQQLAAQQAEQARIAEATRQEAERVAARQAEERRVAAAALAERDRQAQAARPPVQVAAAPVPVTVVDRPAATPPATPSVSTAAATVAGRRESNDDVLARIIRNLDIPASELGVGPPPAPAAPATSTTFAADAEAARRAAAKREADERAAEVAKAAEARKLAAARAAAAKKAADAKKLADEKKAEAAEAAKLAAAKRADPERHWVQVAGGANVAGLPAAWAVMAGKAPALKGRQAWTTPLRATNRLLTGPFKTDDEAQAFVNTLRKSGVQAFAFTSEVGQKVTRVPIK